MGYTHFDKVVGMRGVYTGARGAEVKVPSTFFVTATLPGTAAATAANYGVVFVAPVACQLVSVQEAHTTAGTDGGDVTLTMEKLTGTQAPDAGVDMLGATINLKGTINKVQAPALSATAANTVLAAGDRVCLKDDGNLTAVAGVCVILQFACI